jgi:hypothetical protein
VGGLSDIGSMKVIVVRHVLAIVILERHQKRDQRLGWYFKSFHQITLLQIEKRKRGDK